MEESTNSAAAAEPPSKGEGSLLHTEGFAWASTIFVLILGCVAAFYTRSWDAMTFAAGILLVPNLVAGSASSLSKNGTKNHFMPFHVAVVGVAISFVVMGIVGMVERVLWTNLDHVPSMFVSQDYESTYGANDHRQFRLVCELRKAMIQVHEIDGRIYARCGALFPGSYTIAAPAEQYRRALSDTINDPKGQPVYFYPKDLPDKSRGQL